MCARLAVGFWWCQGPNERYKRDEYFLSRHSLSEIVSNFLFHLNIQLKQLINLLRTKKAKICISFHVCFPQWASAQTVKKNQHPNFNSMKHALIIFLIMHQNTFFYVLF